MNLPSELKHLEEFKDSASLIRKGLYRFNVPQWKKDGSLNTDWLKFRNYCLGASAVASVMGASKWTSAYALFQNKVDEKIQDTKTMLMLCGSLFEQHIVDMWKCWDTDRTWLENVYNKNIIRKCHNVNGFVINIDYPYFAISYDRMVYANQVNPHTGEVVDFSYPLEIKNLSKYTKSNTIDPQYLMQMLIQAKVWGSPMVEFCANVGNSQLMLINIDLRDTENEIVKSMLELQDTIVQEGTTFMNNVFRTKELRELVMYAETEEEVADYTEELQRLEPDVDHLASTQEALLDNKSDDYTEVNIDNEQSAELIDLQVNGEYLEKQGKKLKDLAKNKALQYINSNGLIKFDGGYISYKPKDETRVRSFYKFVTPEDTEVNEKVKNIVDSFISFDIA